MNEGVSPFHDLLRSFPDGGVKDDPAASSSRVVYCVPAAGAGARTFLLPHAPSPLRQQLRVVQLPGREDRIGEPCLEDIHDMAALVAEAIAADGCGDYALFGHSFGALVMLETARILEQTSAPAPAVLGVAACAPPQLPPFASFDQLDPAEIVEALQDLGGLDLRGQRGERLKPLVLPALTADSRAFTRYLAAPPRAPIASPVLALCGSRDPAVTVEQAAGWREHTRSAFAVQEFRGGHFFPLESELPLRAVAQWKDGHVC